MKVRDCIEEIDGKFDQKNNMVQIDFSNQDWLKEIDSKTGWYFIKTNAPEEELCAVPKPVYKAHINIPGTIEGNRLLLDLDIAIKQSNKNNYVVYNGEATSLKARAREHVFGHPKTYCLGLSKYEKLHRFSWTFHFIAISDLDCLKKIKDDNKLLRIAVEQGWRAKNGWPILCKK
ncbi:MAG: hypothetical protein A3K22_03205 [Deltaproteobacteria bacterium RBG_16_42_7]|nr:MAG: hypothetical protein A3K22_03205 [Deltaproteobacteria bacterium RBG_16_42_7]